jgi:DNA-binding transcriptional MerR regulator
VRNERRATREGAGQRRPGGERGGIAPFDDEDVPLYTVGQVAQMLAVKQAFLRRVDELRVVSPQRSAGGQRRYTRVEIRVIAQVASMADEGMTMPAIRRIIELERQLAEVTRERDELARRLSATLRETALREQARDAGRREPRGPR